MIVLNLLIVGCNKSTEVNKDVYQDHQTEKINTEKEVAASEPIKEAEEVSYVFEIEGIEIAMHAEVAPILKRLGESMAFFEAESCAYQGMEKIYTYNGFELYTYEIDGIDYVASVIFLDDTVTTKEGVYLYMTLEQVVDAYGDDYTENLGLYTYELQEGTISFLIDNNEVVSIEYIAIRE